MHLKSRTLLRCISFFFCVKGSSGQAPSPKSCAVLFKGERGNGVDQRVVAVGWKPDGVRGPDTGFDCISMRGCGEKLTAFLSELFSEDTLPKTVLYSLDPTQNALLDTVIGCFQGTEAVGKLQHGAAWWFNDTKTGMKEQLHLLICSCSAISSVCSPTRAASFPTRDMNISAASCAICSADGSRTGNIRTTKKRRGCWWKTSAAATPHAISAYKNEGKGQHFDIVQGEQKYRTQ